MTSKLIPVVCVPFLVAFAWLATAQESLDREQKARQLFAREEWAASAQVWSDLAKENPARAALWQNYAYSSHASGQYQAAVSGWERALELGYRPRATLYNLACAESMRGNHGAALGRLQEALVTGWQYDDLLWNDTDLNPLRELPGFQEITGITPPPETNRQKRWRYDLNHLIRRMEMLHHDLYAVVDSGQFANEISQLIARIESLSDTQILIELQRISALVGDGHTAVDLLEFPFSDSSRHDRRPAPFYLPSREYPVDLYYFSDGLFVRSARPPVERLAGHQVKSIGGFEVEEALARIAPYCSTDNAMGLLFQAPRMLVLPLVAQAAALTEQDGSLLLELVGPDGASIEVALNPVSMPSANERFLYLAGNGNPNADAPLPDYLKNPSLPFWWKLDKARRLVYFQMNMVIEAHGRSLADTCREMFEILDGKAADTLIIDLRHNMGGDATLLRPLIHGVIRSDIVNRREHLFVITGRRTFSAAVNCVNQLERETEALFVGEPPASSPNFVGERSILTLPYSGLRVSVSSLYWQDSDPRDNRLWVAPDLPAQIASTDWFENRDPAMRVIFQQLGR